MITAGYASRWLAWAADHGGVRVVCTDPPPADTRCRARHGHPQMPTPARLVPAALSPTPAGLEPAASADPWNTVLTDLRAAGSRDGANAADWWAQDTVGGRTTGDVTTTARRVLVGIDDGDPRVLDLLPQLPEPDAEQAGELYGEATGADAHRWDDLDHARRREAIAVYRDAYDTAAQERAAVHCRTVDSRAA